jgi:RNA polymerase sigma-70 factor (ECF subfamily)
MRQAHLEELESMTTTMMSANSFQGAWVPPEPAAECGCFGVVKAFGNRVFSIAKYITQNDDDASDVLIETFLEVCPDLDGLQDKELVRLRLLAVAVREAFAKLHNRSVNRPLLDGDFDWAEDLLIREYSIRGDYCQQQDSTQRTVSVLQWGLRNLDPMCRTVFVLRDIEGIPVQHIATIVSRSVPAVEICLLRARLQLREMLAPLMKLQ